MDTDFKPLKVIGLMSGTSMDGIDAAFIESDGLQYVNLGPHTTSEFEPSIRTRLVDFVESAPDKGAHAEEGALEVEMTNLHAEAVRALVAKMGVNLSDIDLVGFHGQTIWHRPQQRQTWQMGDGNRLAKNLGIPVVFDFRSADVAAGGQGAPLAPVFHQHMVRDVELPAVVLNIGGVANITWVGGNGDLLAFDTGPGGGLLDDWMRRRQNKQMDMNGALAASGKAQMKYVDEITSHEYFIAPAPKSLDRFDFKTNALDALSDEDGAATLVALTAECIRIALEICPSSPKTIYVTGGGRHNATLISEISSKTDVSTLPVEALGWNGDAIEAQAFAFMAVRHIRGLPITFPGSTGAPHPLTGGRYAAP